MLGNFLEGWDMIIVLVIVLLLFGPKNLPKLAQSIGKSVRELKNGLHGLTDDLKDTMTTPPEPRKPDVKIETPAASQEPKKEDDTHTTTV